MFWSCSFSLCWTQAESKLDTVVRTEVFSELFFVHSESLVFTFSSRYGKKFCGTSKLKYLICSGTQECKCFHFRPSLNLPFNPLFKNAPEFIILPNYNMIIFFKSILYCHLMFVVGVDTYSSNMPCLNSLLTCTNIYYNYGVVLKLTSLVLLLIGFCFIATIIISAMDSKSCIHEIVNYRYWLWAWNLDFQTKNDMKF